jgi:hypothetical protein
LRYLFDLEADSYLRWIPPDIIRLRLQAKILNRLFTIGADAVLPRYRCNPPSCGTVWEECLTVADMNRLEQAARVSMGEFQDPEASADPLSPPHHTLLWGVVLAAAATILLIGLFQLT